ncbi:AbrB family transcriptional regulator [Pseudonocardia sp. WMMC193]|uniref:AbrB family transcriptional regulator n=1 Tax=Pseudonocardia sp. WMMC193 TaxID=2911965 RepID=UPI001F169AA2|nr:AbrB family transcriptional regulator [Pseudonocardia sp. WMMC193]MCF7549152.1 AbrB family transcriptional regulator [Pseudonocardia sp. WMMC193]
MAVQRIKDFPWGRWALLLVLTVGLTAVLQALGVPSPALFAGLAVATVLALIGIGPERVARPATSGAQAVIGVVIGVLATPGTLSSVAVDWLPVLLVSLGTLAVSMAAGLLLGLQRGVSPLTGMLALTAGGASGLVAVTRELGGDERIVSVIQYLRVGMVTATMPIVATAVFGAAHVGVGGGAQPSSAPWYLGLALVAVCALVGVPVANRLHVPAGALLGPMVLALALSLGGLTFGASPPEPLVDVAYAVIGWQAGLRFTRPALRIVLRVLPAATALILAIVAACAGLGLVLSWTTDASLLDGYLATTPGGVYAVLATAISSGGDVTFVVAVQVVRVILMLLVAPFIARLVGRRWS